MTDLRDIVNAATPTDGDCACRPSVPARGVLKESADGAGLSLYCGGCGGWVEDSWLFTDGIPVTYTVESSPDYTGDWITMFVLEPLAAREDDHEPA